MEAMRVAKCDWWGWKSRLWVRVRQKNIFIYEYKF